MKDNEKNKLKIYKPKTNKIKISEILSEKSKDGTIDIECILPSAIMNKCWWNPVFCSWSTTTPLPFF